MNGQRKRLLCASTCVVALLALPVLVSQVLAVQGEASATSYATPFEQVVSEPFALDESLPQKMFNRFVRVPNQQAPDSDFVSEVLDPASLGAAQTYTGEALVGICWERQAEVSAAAIEAELKAQGWQRIGISEIATTYIKETGKIRWLYVSIAQTNQATTALFAYTYWKED